MFGSLLQPMTNGVLELLVPHHRARSYRMNTTASGTQVLVLLHQIHQQRYGTGIEIDIAVQSQKVGILGHDILTINRDWQFHQTVPQKVVHVHDLRPSLTMPNTVLVLEMGNELGLARQCPNQTSSVRRRVLLRWSQPDGGLMDFGSRLINRINQELHKPIALNIVITMIGNFESVIEENVSCAKKGTES